MPRPRRPDAPEPKRRSRKGCWPCKARKVKCGEEKPSCLNCQRQGEVCDYSIRLNWDGRAKRGSSIESPNSQPSSFSSHVLSFSLSTLDPVGVDPLSTGQPPDPSCVPAENNSPGQAPVTPASYGAGLNGFPESPPTTHDFSYTNRTSPIMSPPSQIHEMTTKWPEQPAQLTVAQDTTSHYPAARQGSLDHVPYPSPEETCSSISSLNTFNFTPTSVSQPTSFLRQSADIDKTSSERDTLPDRFPKRARLHPPFSTDPFGTYGRDCSHMDGSMQCPGNLSLDPDLPLLPGTKPNIPKSSASVSTPGDLFTNVTDEHLVSDTSPGVSCGSAVDMSHTSPESANAEAMPNVSKRKWQAYLSNVEDNYGFDCGRPDLDLNKNNDHAAIDINSALVAMSSKRRASRVSESLEADTPEEYRYDGPKFGYYECPVPINLPRHLSPLPSSLLENPINLMYFHHYLNHTGRMLVPHDCEDNPFVTVMPSMAISDPNLLNLMLAYSASHRARYLEHPEPANRIAHWVSNVFPTLRLALDGPHENITDSHLAAAMMLLSLKIISPSTFEVPITWQSHLKLARGLFVARSEHLSQPGNRVGAFFARWLGYLDIFGALSCRHNEPPLPVYNSVLSACCGDQYDDLTVECFSGYTLRTGAILTRLAGLVNQCDNERFDDMGRFIADWKPSADMVVEAETLMGELEELDVLAHASGRHFEDSEPLDMVAIDKVFRYAGMLHLHRRVLCTPPSSIPVQRTLNDLTHALTQTRHEAPAEVGALFPLFTAGCETHDPQQRMDIMERFNLLEKTGLKQIQNARHLLQRCWDEDLPWIALAQGEFLG